MRTPSAQIVGLLTGLAGLLASFFLLDREPLLGVLGILGTMALLLRSLEKLCGSSSTERFFDHTTSPHAKR
jgi:hypothetical protein